MSLGFGSLRCMMQCSRHECRIDCRLPVDGLRIVAFPMGSMSRVEGLQEGVYVRKKSLANSKRWALQYSRPVCWSSKLHQGSVPGCVTSSGGAGRVKGGGTPARTAAANMASTSCFPSAPALSSLESNNIPIGHTFTAVMDSYS